MSADDPMPKLQALPYLVFWNHFEMSRNPQTHQHLVVLYAYSSADALVEARLTVTRPNQTIYSVRPPITDADRDIVGLARQLMPQTGGHGYTTGLR